MEYSKITGFSKTIAILTIVCLIIGTVVAVLTYIKSDIDQSKNIISTHDRIKNTHLASNQNSKSNLKPKEINIVGCWDWTSVVYIGHVIINESGKVKCL